MLESCSSEQDPPQNPTVEELQQMLLRSEKLASIGLLAGGIAHELSNPVASILLYAQMLVRELNPKDPHYKDAKEIESAGQRCKTLLNELLLFIRNDPSLVRSVQKVEVDVHEALRSALYFCKLHSLSKKIKTVDKVPKIPIFMQGERNTLVQLFLNIFQNAFQAMPEGGELELSYQVQEKNATVYGVWEIKDQGMGIDPKDMPRIFDPLFTTKKAGDGTGLGLAICRRICLDLGGFIEIQSTLEVGTCCKVFLPVK